MKLQLKSYHISKNIRSRFTALSTLAIITASVFVILPACNNNDSSHISDDTTLAKPQVDTLKKGTERKVLIEQLQQLQAILASGNKEKIADIFTFPLADTTVGIFIDNDTFNEEWKKNGGKTTRTMFLRFFPHIAESLWLEEINNLFKYSKLENLLYKDTLRKEVLNKKNPCSRFYDTTIEGDRVTFSVGTDVNESYNSTSGQENSSEYCEFVMWWVFRFDGKKLNLEKIHGAG